MSDSNDFEPSDGARPPAHTEPLRIVGAEEAGQLVGRTGDSDSPWSPTASNRAARRPVFESVPDAPTTDDDLLDLGSIPWADPAEELAAAVPAESVGRPGVHDDVTVHGTMRATTPGPSGGEADEDLSQELELPHWTAPPTGQVPSVLVDDSRKDEAWAAYASAPRWRDEGAGGWDDDLGGVADLVDLDDEEPAPGALTERARPVIDDFFAFDDDDPSEPTPRPVRTRSGRRGVDRDRADTGEHRAVPAGGGRPGAAPARSGRNIPVAVALGVGLAALAIALFRMGPGPTMLFVLVLLGIGAAEYFDASRRGGYRPATLLGLAACVGLPAAVYWRGDAAYPIVGGLVIVAGLLWFLFGVDQEQVTADLGVTMLGVAYVGGLGSFAALILRAPGVDTTRVLLGAVVPVVASDVFAYVVGRNAGRSPLMPHVSPNKTVEGMVGGVLGAVVSSVVFNQLLGSNPWSGFGPALELGLLVAFMAPLGDLAESLIKRDLGIKDMGTILPGHGGVLDRFDAMLFTLPGVYFLALLLDVIPS